MKNLFLFLIPALFAATICKASSPKPLQTQGSGDSIGVVISDAKLSLSQHGSLAASIQGMAGVNYITYCSNHAAYVVYIKASMYKDKFSFLNQVMQNTGFNQLYIKNWKNPMEVLDHCTMNNSNAESLKLRYGK